MQPAPRGWGGQHPKHMTLYVCICIQGLYGMYVIPWARRQFEAQAGRLLEAQARLQLEVQHCQQVAELQLGGCGHTF